ncbi:ABC transporter permease [Merismopedia glauca]|uniref:ABC transporter permease n=1 Tax=Merismopedia glauca CCAP 1448/3 TaxID=1296344 RepID=A0A2T1C2L6_9CYAN|nr:ABC transporter permease [Merismopedia glauca]PSB02492.1 ABC transporter permease [Merismopedia glauca CCAP 1448/3]
MSRSKALQYYVAARVVLAPLMLLTVVTLVFLLLRSTPGDPIDALLTDRASPEAKEELRVRLGLDKPLWVQYFAYMGGLLHFDLGNSIVRSGQPVSEIIGTYFPATVELAVYSMAIALLVGIGIGVFSASRPNGLIDAGGRLFSIISYALPIFWVGMIMQLIFAVQLGWFPVGGRWDNSTPPQIITGLYTIDSLLSGNIDQFFTSFHYLALPCLTLGVLLSGMFERMVRVNLKEALKADYVEAARARGIPEKRILLAHALKNALIPVITIVVLTIATLLGGAVLTEVTFSWDGLGYQLYDAISKKDFPVVQGVMVFFGAIVTIASILIDVVNAYIDPRIRY